MTTPRAVENDELATMKERQGKMRSSAQTTDQWIEFQIHDLMTMRVAADAPTASLLKDMFAPFLTDQPQPEHQLTVGGRIEPVDGVSYGETEYEYTDSSTLIKDMEVQILVRDGAFHVNGAGELLVSVLPIVDHIVTTRGAAMVHAATVGYRGNGICLPAWGGTGKTSTMAKLLKKDGYSFMGDDWAFVNAQGELLSYEKPLFIKPHHRPIYPHLFNRRRKPLVPVRLSRPLGRLTTRVHPIVTRYPRLARMTRQLSPEHMMVSPREAFPDANFASRLPLAAVIFVERFQGTEAIAREMHPSWMVSRLIGNFHAEVTAHSRDVMTALAASGLIPIEQFFARKAQVLRQALVGKPTYLLQVPQSFSPDRASDVIVEHLERIFAETGIDPKSNDGAEPVAVGRQPALAEAV
jgi:hypothetical protein